MTADDFIAKSEAELGKAFPELVIRLFPDPDDASTFFAYMFCVPDGTEREVKNRAREIIRRFDEGEWSVIPSIKNLSVTKEHYPQYLKTDPVDGILSNAAILKYIVCDQPARVSYTDLFEVIADADYIGCPPCVTKPPQAPHESGFKLAA